MAKWALILVVAAVAVGSALALFSPDQTSSVPDPASVTVPSVQALLPIARNSAVQWRQDAYLSFVSVWLRPKLEVHLTFDSPSDPKVELGVTFKDPLNSTNSELDEARSETREVVMWSIEQSAGGSIDSPEAYAIALASGGRAFALNHPEADYWMINLQFVSESEVAWRVWSSNVEFENVSYEVLIDPSTGRVLEVKEGP